jgi:hypothetical protein
VQRERKGNAKTRKRGARLKIEKLKTSGLLELTLEALQGKSVRDSVLEKLNVPGRTSSAEDTPREVGFDYEEVISLDDYDTESRSVLETDATLEESQAKRVCSRSQVEREAQDLRNRLEQSRTFRRETGLMNFRTDRLGPPVQTASSSRASDDYWVSPDDGVEQYRRLDSRSPAHGNSWGGKTHAEIAPADLATVADRGSGGQTTSRDGTRALEPKEDARGRGPLNAEATTRLEWRQF